MDKENDDTTTIVLLKGKHRGISVEMPGTDLECADFFKMFNLLLSKTVYSKHEIEEYILDWAESIRFTKEN